MIFNSLSPANISINSRTRKTWGTGNQGGREVIPPCLNTLFCQMIPYLRSFSYRVVRLMSSILAAFARLFPACSSAWSNNCFSFSSSVRPGVSSCLNVRSRFRSVAVIQSPPASSRERRTVFLSSRILPGQGYCLRAASAAGRNPAPVSDVPPRGAPKGNGPAEGCHPGIPRASGRGW